MPRVAALTSQRWGGEAEEGDEPDRDRLVACTPKHRTQIGEKTKPPVREDFRSLSGEEELTHPG